MRNQAPLQNMMTTSVTGINPSCLGEVLRRLSPLKVYENLAAGKPVVVTTSPEAQGMPGVFAADTFGSFASGLEHAAEMAEDPSFVAQLRTYAWQHSWLTMVQEFLGRPTARGSTAGQAPGEVVYWVGQP